ncbi:MAG TPA: hypothetical protein VFH68_15570 [Polyangia bacterium]|jgi:hypothetical protein|nr:hypothetical protein [Polyangia bacterium]
MWLLVIEAPADPALAARAAAATQLAAADLRYRLQGTLPRVLMSAADGERLTQVAERLEPLGFVTVVCDPRLAPTDAERLVARALRLQRDALVAVDGAGGEHQCPWSAVGVIQRGVRVSRQTTKEKTVEHKFDVTRAVLSSGLILTRKETKEVVRVSEASEPFALLQRNDGEPDIILYERRIDYRFLGGDMQPSSRANLETAIRRVRAAAPAAVHDDRVARPGFVGGLPALSGPADPVDQGLFAVSLALRRRESSAG